jgi:hypothetical protein
MQPSGDMVHVAEVAEDTSGVASKYDSYWSGQLAEIRAAVERAASGPPATLELAGLTSMGERQSWYGAAEVRDREVTRSSMAHATSMGKVIAANGLCVPWPDSTFQFTIATAGNVLTVSAVDTRRPQRAKPAAMGPGLAPVKSVADHDVQRFGSTVGTAVAGDDRGHLPDDAAVDRFYLALGELAEILHCPRLLRDCHGTDGWPRQGVYFFYEPGEVRADGRDRVVRVGTHALTTTSQATLWGRLRQHRGHLTGTHPGGGNHRASVFRRHVGAAIINRERLPPGLLESWLDRHGPRPDWAEQEEQIEQAVGDRIGIMPFLWLSVPDRADRACVERNSIALTSRLAEGRDQPSARWLGHDAVRTEISQSGLWNVDHTRHRSEPGFLDLLDQLIRHQP